jgi:signal transduction histidine kinase/ligand-binding sensor domain-containing protein/DNA-binding response OmpR family regulator
MDSKKMKYFFFITYLFLSLTLFSQESSIRFRKLSPEGGFSFRAILSIEQDHQGFIWFGTKNGLYKHDSRNIIRYNNETDDSHSLIDDRINLITKDKVDKLWIATESGLCYFDYVKNRFFNYPIYNSTKQQVDRNITSMVFDHYGKMWIISDYGPGIVDINNQSFEAISLKTNIGIPNGLCADAKNRIWITTNNGYVLKKQNENSKFDVFCRIREANINTLAVQEDKLWLGYDWEGVDFVGPDGQLINHYNYALSEASFLPSNRVRSICIDKSDRIWIGTYRGILLINPDGSQNIIQQENNPDLAANSVWKIFQDKNEGIWIGCWNGGLSYYNKYDNVFHHYKNDESGNSISNNVVTGFSEDKSGNIWITTENEGINYFNRATNTFTSYKYNVADNSVYNFKSVYVDDTGVVWAGTYRFGLWYKNNGSAQFQQLNLPEIRHRNVYSIFKKNNYLWIATYNSGLIKLDIDSKETTHFTHDPVDSKTLSNNQLRHVFEDSKGNLWVSSIFGLNIKKKGSDNFIRFYKEKNNPYSLNSNEVFYCFEDTKGNIWICTGGGGLSKTSPDDFRFKTYTKNNGLASNYVYGISEDLNGNMWISTDAGLSFFNISTEQFRNFKAIDGIQSDQFLPGAVLKTASGEMLFGGPNGFTLFDPAQININPIKPNAKITGFKIKNADAILSDFLVPEKDSTEYKLVLNNEQNAFSFSFAADNYLLPEKNKFKYRLKNFNENWVDADVPIAVYTNIPAGPYTFELKAANNDGIWNDTPYRLDIQIKRPLALSNLALFVYFIFIAGLFMLIRRIISERQKLRNEIVFEKIQRKNEEELHQMKLRFFTNISHEFRTPLSLILMPLQRLIKKNTIDGKNELLIIKNNASRLLRLINQLMDLRKIDNNRTKLKPEKVNIVHFCKEIFDCFNSYAEQKSIAYTFEAEDEIMEAEIDKEMIDKIVYNFLSNAFKFSKEKGQIKLCIEKSSLDSTRNTHFLYKTGALETEDYLEISVEDSGIGIGRDELPRIFERFYQADEKQYHGTGIGLAMSKEYALLHNGEIEVYSQLNKGSRFSIRLPLRQQNAVVNPTFNDSNGSFKHENLWDYETIQNTKTKTVISTPAKSTESGRNLILVVEDNAELSQYIRSILLEKYRVVMAVDGKQGLVEARRYMPDLIISDVMMPVMDGFELSRELKKDIQISHIPIIFLTALNSEENQIDGLKTGVDDYLTKPFNEDILLLKIYNILQSRKVLREKYATDKNAWNEKMTGLTNEKLFIGKVKQIILENLDNYNLSVEDVAKKTGISRSQLHRKVKYLTNYNPTEFIRLARLEKAAELLKNGHSEIEQVGYAVGFNSHSYFSKCFKNQFGVTPSEYFAEFSKLN